MHGPGKDPNGFNAPNYFDNPTDASLFRSNCPAASENVRLAGRAAKGLSFAGKDPNSATSNSFAQQDEPGFVKTPLASQVQIWLSRGMPFAHHVFRYTPALRGLITPPDASEMRFGQDRFAEFDAQAEVEGWPSDWRMEHEAREANRQAVLSSRLAQDLWVFAYGSLIWDPAVQVEEYRYGSLSGWHRSFCMQIEGGRGSHERPGLMAALDEGGHCDGVVFRIPTALVGRETEFMWRREMFSGSYCPVFLEITTAQGPVDALVFVMDRENRRYMPDLSEDEAAKIIAVAEGGLGPNFDYLDSLVRHLDELGIEDDEIHRLHARADTYRVRNR